MSIKLKSSDGQVFDADENGCLKSKFLKKLIEGGKNEILLDQIKGEVLAKVVEFLKYYSDKDFPTLPEILKTNGIFLLLTKYLMKILFI